MITSGRIHLWILAIFIVAMPIGSYSQDNLISIADSLSRRGEILIGEECYEEALESFEKAATIFETFPEEEMENYANVLGNIGYCYHLLAEHKKAILFYTQGIEKRQHLAKRDYSNEVTVLSNIGNCYFALEDYVKAIDYYQRSLDLKAFLPGLNHPHYMESLYEIGLCYYYLEDYEKAIAFISTALSISNPDRETLSDLLYTIAESYYAIDDCEKALGYYLEASEIHAELFGKNNEEYGSTLYRIGLCYDFLDQKDKALDYYLESLRIAENILEINHPFIAQVLNYIGRCYYDLDDFEKALNYSQLAISIVEEDTTDYRDLDLRIGVCHYFLEDYNLALEHLLPSLENNVLDTEYFSFIQHITGKCYEHLFKYRDAVEHYQIEAYILASEGESNDIDYSDLLMDIGDCYFWLGDYNLATDYELQSLALKEKVLGSNHPDYATCLSTLGHSFLNSGDYGKALEFNLAAEEILRTNTDHDPHDYTICLLNLSFCYMCLGEYDNSLKYTLQAKELWKYNQEDAGIYFPAVLKSVGICYTLLGDNKTALDYSIQALEYAETLLGNNHPDLVDYIEDLGIKFAYIGDYEKALEYCLQVLKMRETYDGEMHPKCALTLDSIGACYFFLDDYDSALKYCLRALTIREQTLGTTHPQYAQSLENAGLYYLHKGNYGEASELFALYYTSSSSFVSLTFADITESQRTQFWEKYKDFYTDALYKYAVTISTSSMAETAYNGALFGKGLLLNTENEIRTLILESGDKGALDMYYEIQEDQRNLDKLYESPLGKKNLIDSLNNIINSKQLNLVKNSKAYGDFARNLTLKWTDILAELGRSDIAIEFESYTQNDTTYYIALTLRPGYIEPHLVRLFSNEDLKQVRPSWYYKSPLMTELIWGNLRDELSGVKNVYFSPIGELNNISIEYLLDEDGEHLISEKRNYFRLTSTRELVKKNRTQKTIEAVLYGGIMYDAASTTFSSEAHSIVDRVALSSGRSFPSKDSLSLSRGDWDYLSGTKEEAEAISALLTAKNINNELFEGNAGTEESFASLSGARKSVIHIATHGFYWTATEIARSKFKSCSFLLNEDSEAPREDKSLTRSGLLFAGAKRAFEGIDIPSHIDDGIVTAKDISRMDLRGTDLVVLSACQSGLGDITGDGVFGLQRGFKKAGVQSIVMSLWKVSDDATKVLMTRFYENLAKGRNKNSAFRDAQKYLRKYEAGLFDDPNCYAAFVLLDAIE